MECMKRMMVMGCGLLLTTAGSALAMDGQLRDALFENFWNGFKRRQEARSTTQAVVRELQEPHDAPPRQRARLEDEERRDRAELTRVERVFWANLCEEQQVLREAQRRAREDGFAVPVNKREAAYTYFGAPLRAPWQEVRRLCRARIKADHPETPGGSAERIEETMMHWQTIKEYAQSMGWS